MRNLIKKHRFRTPIATFCCLPAKLGSETQPNWVTHHGQIREQNTAKLGNFAHFSTKKYPNTTNVVAGILLMCYFRIQKIAVPLQRQSEQTA